MSFHKSGGGQWGISWSEVAASIQEYEEHFSCKLEHVVLRTGIGRTGAGRQWTVACRAISGRAGAYRLEGYAECIVGGARGAASFPGAFVRSILDACEDLDRRRKNPRYDRDTPVPARS